MLRGFRWQLLAFIAALSLFLAVLFSRPQQNTIFVPETPSVSVTDQSPVATSSEIVLTPEPTSPVVMQPDAPPATDTASYREALIGQVQRINPVFASLNPVDTDLTSLIFEGLMRINPYGEPEGALAESWKISGDGLEYVFNLRKDVLWQDGLPFTAADVDYTMSILRSPDFPGARELSDFWRTVETAILDDYTVRFRLTQPFGGFLEALRIGILPVHALQGISAVQLAAHPFNLSPIGTGPYQLAGLRSSDGNRIQRVDLRVAPVYRQRPEGAEGYALDSLSFNIYETFDQALQALQAGEVDGLAARDRSERNPLLRASTSGVITIRNGIDPTVGILIFNWGNENFKVFREQRVRVALQTGLDRNSIIERNLNNQAVRADSPLLLNSWAYEPNLPWARYDIGQARALLADARIDLSTSEEETAETEEAVATDEIAPVPTSESPASGTLFAFAILTPDDPALIAVAQEMANQWGLLNITVTVDAVDLETYRTRLEGHDFQAALVELTKEGSADPDVYAFWHQGQYPDGKNYGGADDRTISELLEKARRDPFGINRGNDYETFQQVFIDRAIAIPLYYPLYTYAINARIQGVQLAFIGAPSDRFLTIKDWTITG